MYSFWPPPSVKGQEVEKFLHLLRKQKERMTAYHGAITPQPKLAAPRFRGTDFILTNMARKVNPSEIIRSAPFRRLSNVRRKSVFSPAFQRFVFCFSPMPFLKNPQPVHVSRNRAVDFSVEVFCKILSCEVGDIMKYIPDD